MYCNMFVERVRSFTGETLNVIKASLKQSPQCRKPHATKHKVSGGSKPLGE